MKLSDYVFQFIADKLGVGYVFGIVGGANTHLADSLGCNSKLKFVATIHEQGAAMAAEGYARASGKMGICLVTSGPGGTNAITGFCGAWCDSIPCLFISGQVPSVQYTDGKTIRQLGVQQINIIEGVKPYSKYAVIVTDPLNIRCHLEKAVFLARDGRPGPVWLDIPTEIQRANIEPGELVSYQPSNLSDKPRINLDGVTDFIVRSERPILIAGFGIKASKAKKEFLELANLLKFPVITTWNGIDLIDHGHPLYVGCAGVMGQRGTNYAVANSDLILSIGSRLDTQQVGKSPDLYARAAKKIVVDIDPHELSKGLIAIDLPITCDAGRFIKALIEHINAGGFISKFPVVAHWLSRCLEWKYKYPVVPTSYSEKFSEVNSYVFIDKLSRQLGKDDIIVTDMGTSLTCTMQTFQVKDGQTLFTNTGLAPMGYGLPGAIGAWFGGGGRRVIGIFGDGGFQMNIQELQTVKQNSIPLKIFILNNRSYLTIKHTQETFFDRHYVGSEPGSGYSAPNFCRIAEAYGIQSIRIENMDQLYDKIEVALNASGPVLCEVMMPENQDLIPVCILDKARGYAGSPIERMYPFLSEDEHKTNMLIDPV